MEANVTLLEKIDANVSSGVREGAQLSATYDLHAMLLVASLLSVLTLTTVAGNLLVGLTLVRYPKLRTVSNYLIGNLVLLLKGAPLFYPQHSPPSSIFPILPFSTVKSPLSQFLYPTRLPHWQFV